jgi:putative ABC transport system permease protein
MAVGILVLIVTAAACFNYINLTTARSLKRAKEVGVRKVVGGRRLQLTWQFVSEAMIIALAACVLAFPMLHLLIPAFNSLWAVQWTGSQISPNFENELSTYLIAVAFSLFVGLFAGLYPAFFLSSFHATGALRGPASIERSSGLSLRKSLVVVQFAFSLIFIVTTLLLYQQSRLMAKTDFGFNKARAECSLAKCVL